MKELRQILKSIDEAGESAVLATVVDVRGSSYRLPGAKMLVFRDGGFVGTVSGGCIEADVLERAKRVLESGAPEMFLYDTTGDESSVFSLNMGCKGIVRILLERVDSESDYLAVFRRAIEEGVSGFVATRLRGGDNGEAIVERSFFDSGGELVTGDPAGDIVLLINGYAAEGITARRPAEIVDDSPSGEYFLERVIPPTDILICGAGADAIPLADIAHRLGWRVTVVDHRPAYANEERFPDADKIVVCRPDEIAEIVRPGAAAVVMSHNLGNDTEYLRTLLASDARYLGVLGPRVRTEEMVSSINEGDGEKAERELSRLHAPVGLDIGGSEPETIAVSIIAEIQASFSSREGGPLRERQGRIYD